MNDPPAAARPSQCERHDVGRHGEPPRLDPLEEPDQRRSTTNPADIDDLLKP
jgi:hypothetical protein